MDIGRIVRFSWTTILTRRRARMKGKILGCLEHEGKSTGSHPNEQKERLCGESGAVDRQTGTVVARTEWGIRHCTRASRCLAVPANGVHEDICNYVSASPGYLAWVDTKGQEMG